MRPKKPRDGALIDAMVERSRTQARLEAALGWSRHRVQTVAVRYRLLRRALPKTCALWRDGTIDGYTAAKVVEAAERRHRRALADRKVCPSMEPDGMGSLWAMAGAADITAIDHRLTGLAKDLGADDSRTMDQRRADLFVDLLLGTDPGGVSGSPGVGVVVPIQSLMGMDDTPGELVDRSNTVPTSLARQIAARPGTLFYRLLTDERGHLLDVTQLGRFPSKLLGYAVDVRDGTCRWSTSTTAASKADCDHTVPHPDGPTAAWTLGDDCRRHHRAKTAGRLRLKQSEPGVFVWTTPSGHRYVVEPEPLPIGHWPTPRHHRPGARGHHHRARTLTRTARGRCRTGSPR